MGLNGSNQSIVAVHYNIDGVSPPVETPILEFRPTLHSSNTNTWVPTILGLRKDGLAVVPVYDYDQKEPIDIYLIDTEKGLALPNVHKAVLPKKAHVSELCLSHSGEHLVWLLHIDAERFSKRKSMKRSSVEIWISKYDGSELKRLSYFTPILVMTEDLYSNHIPGVLRWSFDDSAISYIKDQTLHLVKVK